SGRDLSLVSYAKTVPVCLEAAARLAGEGIEAEVIDLRSIKPLDLGTVLDSVRRTGRVVVVHEASRSFGVGAELAALVAEHAFEVLKSRPLRLGGPDAPAAASFPLEQAFVPSADAVRAAAHSLLRCG